MAEGAAGVRREQVVGAPAQVTVREADRLAGVSQKRRVGSIPTSGRRGGRRR